MPEASPISWLSRPLVSNDEIILDGLQLESATDDDLKNICLRMAAILESIEMPRAEGRLLPAEIFDQLDALDDRLFHGPRPRLAEWTPLVRDFGAHYSLTRDKDPIQVDSSIFREKAERYGVTKANREVK